LPNLIQQLASTVRGGSFQPLIAKPDITTGKHWWIISSTSQPVIVTALSLAL